MRSQENTNPRQGVYYSIFVRSFADSDGDGIGDLNGITSKLDYLEKLGVSGIWLLPIFPSESYHGYSVEDYYSVNPDYGTLDDFRNLCAKAEEHGISVIIDMVLNHSSVHNKWFIESVDENSPKHAWYRWANPEANPEINFSAQIYGHKVWNQLGNNFYAGLYSKSMPDFNHDNPEVRAEFKSILKFWLEQGASGFRFDAAHNVYNLAKLPVGTTDGQKRAVEFWQEICGFVRTQKPDAFMVGEVWDTAGIRADYMRALPSTFHFDLGTKIISAVKNADASNNALAKSLANDYASYAAQNPAYIDAPFISNHDQNRFALQFKNNADSLKLAASLYLFLPGIPFIYYGEELGMNGAKPDEQIRTPFIWSAESVPEQTKWIESKYNKKTIPADRQAKDKNSVLNFYRNAVNFRNSNEALTHGTFSVYESGNASIISWLMRTGSDGNKKAWCFFNVSPSEQKIARPENSEGCKVLFSTKNAALKNSEISLGEKGVLVLGN